MIYYIIALLLFGIGLLVLEVVILPGLIAGIIGGLFILFALGWVFAQYGNAIGICTSIATLAVTGLVLYFALRSKLWKRFSLTDSLQGNKMNVIDDDQISVGDIAKALSALRPMGTIIIGNKKIEAQTNLYNYNYARYQNGELVTKLGGYNYPLKY